jgi:hypothetical protein
VLDRNGIPIPWTEGTGQGPVPKNPFGVTAALLGPRTMEHLGDLLADAEVMQSDDILDRIYAIVPPGPDVGQLDMAYQPPAIVKPALRRRPIGERTAA